MKQWFFSLLALSFLFCASSSWAALALDKTDTVASFQPITDLDLNSLSQLNDYAKVNPLADVKTQIHAFISSASLFAIDQYVQTSVQTDNQSCGLIKGPIYQEFLEASLQLLSEYAEKIHANVGSKFGSMSQYLFVGMSVCLNERLLNGAVQWNGFEVCTASIRKSYRLNTIQAEELMRDLRAFQRLSFLLSVFERKIFSSFIDPETSKALLALYGFKNKYMTIVDPIARQLDLTLGMAIINDQNRQLVAGKQPELLQFLGWEKELYMARIRRCLK